MDEEEFSLLLGQLATNSFNETSRLRKQKIQVYN